ncbi:hypothetical protein GQ600_17447 [Phytophthora cactorum]|nr:hypothetical protein GQ600_17447 [Phytophthora cactorum]
MGDYDQASALNVRSSSVSLAKRAANKTRKTVSRLNRSYSFWKENSSNKYYPTISDGSARAPEKRRSDIYIL